jgi:hypothetical protein
VGTEASGHGIQSYLQATGVIACYRAPQRLKTAKSLSFCHLIFKKSSSCRPCEGSGYKESDLRGDRAAHKVHDTACTQAMIKSQVSLCNRS